MQRPMWVNRFRTRDPCITSQILYFLDNLATDVMLHIKLLQSITVQLELLLK